MATIKTENGDVISINPFYQQVNKFVENELKNRAVFYGRRVRASGAAAPKAVEWSYQKTAWATVKSLYGPTSNIILGTPGSNVMSDRKGNLTLYNAERNVPNKPLLSKVEISNEGQFGSFLKSNISFTIFPELTSQGFDIGKIEQAFFVPGREVELKWGWSVYANNSRACTGKFNGIVYNFNWSFNPDMSIGASVSIIAPSALAIGVSADLINKGDSTAASIDPSGKILIGSNLSKVIDSDLAQMPSPASSIDGQVQYVKKADTANKKLDYWSIALPLQEGEQTSQEPSSQSTRTTKVQWYTSFGAVVAFLNELLESFDDPIKEIFTIQCYGNETQYLKDIVSAYPFEVYFPDVEMGKYGPIQPFRGTSPTNIPSGQNVTWSNTNPLTQNIESGKINIGEILLGTDFIKSAYESFISDNSNNIPYKTLPKLMDELCKKINHASGGVYELTPVLFEPSANNIDSGVDGRYPRSVLTVEDMNLNIGLGDIVPYRFEPTIFRPIIRSVSISSDPPPAMAMAAFTAARGNAKPIQSEMRLSTNEQRDNKAHDEEYWDAIGNLRTLKFQAIQQGFSDNWSEQVRGYLVKIKRTSNAQDAHWLHKAVYPVKFSVTLDGINGFKFGDTLSTTMIPAIYNTVYNMVFTVSRVNHVIENKDWSTTIETVARINTIGTGPDPAYAGVHATAGSSNAVQTEAGQVPINPSEDTR
jgi:hypothetical protein